VRFYVDGVRAAADGHARGYNHFEAVVKGLGVGTHRLTTQSSNFNDVIANGDTVTITIDPPRQKRIRSASPPTSCSREPRRSIGRMRWCAAMDSR